VLRGTADAAELYGRNHDANGGARVGEKKSALGAGGMRTSAAEAKDLGPKTRPLAGRKRIRGMSWEGGGGDVHTSHAWTRIRVRSRKTIRGRTSHVSMIEKGEYEGKKGKKEVRWPADAAP